MMLELVKSADPDMLQLIMSGGVLGALITAGFGYMRMRTRAGADVLVTRLQEATKIETKSLEALMNAQERISEANTLIAQQNTLIADQNNKIAAHNNLLSDQRLEIEELRASAKSCEAERVKLSLSVATLETKLALVEKMLKENNIRGAA